MQDWQLLRELLPPEVAIDPTARPDVVQIHAGGRGQQFSVVECEHLTRDWIDSAPVRLLRRALVLYVRASPEARAALRKAGGSYAGIHDGRLLIAAPGLFVERDELARAPAEAHWPGGEGARLRNPFALRASRVPRWLLMHPHEQVTVTTLAASVGLSESVVSRTLRALDEEAVVEMAPAPDDARKRHVELTRPRPLLASWARSWERRRIDSAAWDVGARDAGEAMELLASVAGVALNARWAVGGLAGAALVRRAVEPADVLLWTERDDAVDLLAGELRPRLAPRGRQKGVVRVAIAPDPWVLGLAELRGGVPVADPVQLWLDCATEGERALEAADAVAAEMGW